MEEKADEDRIPKEEEGETEVPEVELEHAQRPWLPYARASFVFGLITLFLESLAIVFFSYVNVIHAMMVIWYLVGGIPWLFCLVCLIPIGVILMSSYAIRYGYRAERTYKEQPQSYRGFRLAQIGKFFGLLSFVIAIPGVLGLFFWLNWLFSAVMYSLQK